MKPKIYISRPIGTDADLLKEVCNLIISYGGVPVYWSEGSHYSEKMLKDSDIVVFITNKSKDNLPFSEPVNDLTRGVRNELLTSVQLQKPIFKVYKPAYTDGRVLIYKATSTINTFKGEQGTTDCLKTLIENLIRQDGNKSKSVDPLGTSYFKGILSSMCDLPRTSNKLGDAYFIGNDLWVWNTTNYGEDWVKVPSGALGISGESGETIVNNPQGLKGYNDTIIDTPNYVINNIQGGTTLINKQREGRLDRRFEIPRIPTEEELNEYILLLRRR